MFNRLWSMGLKLLLVLSFFLPVSVWAGHIITITETSPFPAEVAASSTATAVYTVTNNASRISLTPVDQTQYPSGISRLSSSTCGGLIGPRQSCTIQLQLQAPSTPQTISFALKQWAKPSADAVQLPISVRVAAQSGPSALSVAVGHAGISTTRQAVVAVSTNRAVDWESAAVSGLPTNGQLNAASCTGSGSTAICVGAGEGSAQTSGPPLLVQSVDGGDSWAVQETTISFPNAIYNGASCTGSGLDAVCIAVGANRGVSADPIAAVGTNGGSSWVIATVPSPTATPAAYTTGSCTGSGTSAICVAAGQNVGETILDVSVNGGASWATAAITPYTDGFLRSASCTGAGSSAVCVAVGKKGPSSGSEALVLVGTNSVSSWTSIDNLFSGNNVLLNSVSCTGSGLTAICVAGGINNTTVLPVIAVSQNGGSTWNDAIASGLSSTINAVSCTGEGSNAVCVAVGESATLAPAISVSTDGGATWTVRSVTNPPADSTNLQTVNCIGSGATAVCTAGGVINGSSSPPIIITSNDGGVTWTVRSVTGFSPTDGAINSTAGAAGSTSLTSVGTSNHGAAGGLGVSYQQKTFGIKNKLDQFIK